jgi:site-specific DNA-methyltransferase (adenine-specific)
MTTLTSLLARRSVYCSKDATGKHSIATSFDRDWGNIWFERMEHEWVDRKRERRVDPISAEEVLVEVPGTGKCRWCPAAEQSYARGAELETHAYALLHTDDPRRLVKDIYGDDMHFDVIIGNPPYQLGAQKDESTERLGRVRDVPIYQRFVQAAKALEPRYLTMVTPSRWFAGGLGLSNFRDEMLGDHRIRNIVDFPASSDVFPGVDISGGVSYFLWDASYSGATTVSTVRAGSTDTAVRDLDEFDIFVRDTRSAVILRKVLARGEPSIREILSADKQFGWTSNFNGFHEDELPGDIPIHYNRKGKRLIGYIARANVTKSSDLIDTWKVMVPSAGFEHGGGDGRAMRVLSTPFIVSSPSVCTQTYLFFHVENRAEAESVQAYLATRFLRFLVSLRKITQHASPATYNWVPQQTWDRSWTDAELYAKYGLTDDEQAYIESVIKPMALGSPTADDEE